MMNEEKILGADAAEVVTAERSVHADVAPHVAPTPGPWAFSADEADFNTDEHDDKIGSIVAPLDHGMSWTIAEVCGDLESSEECVANAHLISAAPEMLAALKSLRNEVRAVLELAREELRPVVGNTNVRCLSDRLLDAEAAIAKAEGRS